MPVCAKKWSMAMSTAAEGARTRRDERARNEKERIKRKASATHTHTKLEDTTTPHHQKDHQFPRIYRIFEDDAVYIPHVIPT